MNKVILTGRLTRDPERHDFDNGATKASFTVAVDRRFKDKNGERQTDFIPVTVWSKTADLCCQYLHKGDKAGVIGQIQTRSYDAQDGSKRFVTEVNADEIEFLETRNSAGAGATSSQNTGNKSDFKEVDDELPF